MHIVNQAAAGILILILLAMLIVVKQRATGSILEKPSGTPLLLLVNSFNLVFLLVANPLAAILLVTRSVDALDPSHFAVHVRWLLTGLEIGGVTLCVIGYLLMAWALIALGSTYQLGGSSPRLDDTLVIAGPYRFVRHPMYSAALCISLGLACLIQSIAYLSVFCIYLVLIISLIPAEEKGLRQVYGEQYDAYRRRVRTLIPRVY
jgi:protein-S-isoprenylcysteine O-methyltransferase Ste14